MTEPQASRLTGRIKSGPSALIHEEILQPQFTYEVAYLLPFYVLIERVLCLEYERMGFLDREQAAEIGILLQQVSAATLTADPDANMSDIAFALERYVEEHLTRSAPAWHIDRSRNDFQACAQLMMGRSQLFETVRDLLMFGQSVLELAVHTAAMPMPGYTHFQAAQVISPGFYLAALLDQVTKTARQLLSIYHVINRCPLGSGAMAGQEFGWDRDRMASLLGFDGPQEHALVSVASREWTLRLSAEFSLFSVSLSRFVTDLMLWGSSEYGFINLPDELSGISSAMPQKKNFPILERIRGRTAHVTAFALDLQMGQRNTPFTNMVEVSKEAGTYVITMFQNVRSALRLFTAVLQNVEFRADRMRAACEREFLGGFSLANALTTTYSIPYRKAQTIAGEYIVAALERGLRPDQVEPALLSGLCQRYGYETSLSAEAMHQALDVMANLYGKQSSGSANPDATRKLLAARAEELQLLQDEWQACQGRVEQAYDQINALFMRQEDRF